MEVAKTVSRACCEETLSFVKSTTLPFSTPHTQQPMMSQWRSVSSTRSIKYGRRILHFSTTWWWRMPWSGPVSQPSGSQTSPALRGRTIRSTVSYSAHTRMLKKSYFLKFNITNVDNKVWLLDSNGRPHPPHEIYIAFWGDNVLEKEAPFTSGCNSWSLPSK